jgi:hypothetical protein
MKYIAVLARNHREFNDFIFDQALSIKSRGLSYVIDSNDNYYFFVDDADRMRGMRNLTLVKTGTWKQLPADFVEKVELYARMSHN